MDDPNLHIPSPFSHEFGHDQSRDEQDEVREENDGKEHEKHWNKNDHDVQDDLRDLHPGDGAVDEKAQAIRRRHEAEGQRDNPDHPEMDGMHPDVIRQRGKDGRDDDDRRDRIDEAPDE